MLLRHQPNGEGRVVRILKRLRTAGCARGSSLGRVYQVHLVWEKKLAPSSVVVAVSALRFLYRRPLHKDWNFDQVIPAPHQSDWLQRTSINDKQCLGEDLDVEQAILDERGCGSEIHRH